MPSMAKKTPNKVEYTFGNNGQILQGLCVTVTHEEWNRSTEKMSET